MTAMVEDAATPVTMQDFGLFEATRRAPTAHAYLLRRDAATREAIDRLLVHGITVEELTAPFTATVTRFTIDRVTPSERAFEGHRQTRLTGRYREESVSYQPATFVVRSAQPLATLAAYLLEPESDDGFVTWNVFGSLQAGSVYQVDKLMQASKWSSRLAKATD
jgi:hypothetical protein